MGSCIGCGLRDDISKISIATSGVWGGAMLAAYGLDDSVGEVTYCDDAGEVRGPPPHTSSVLAVSDNDTGLSLGFSAGSSSAYHEVGPVVLANPSSVRQAECLVIYKAKWTVEPIIASQFAFECLPRIDGVDLDLIRKYYGLYAADAHEEQLTESFRVLLEPGESVDFTVNFRIYVRPDNSGEGTLTATGFGARALIATR